MPIAPWLQTPDYLGAMRAGSALGLQIAQKRSADEQAAARLRQAQESLWMQQQQAAQADALKAAELATRQQNAAASLAQNQAFHLDTLARQQQQDALAADRLDYAERKAEEDRALNERRYTAAQALKERQQAFAEEMAKQKASPENAEIQVQEVGDQKFAVNPKTGHFQLLNKPEKGPANSPNVYLSYSRDLKKTLADPEATEEEKANARVQLQDVSKKLRSFLAPNAPEMVPQVTTNAAAALNLWRPKAVTNYVPASVAGEVPTAVASVPDKPKSKVELARELSAANPDWDKKRVIEEVNKLFNQ